MTLLEPRQCHEVAGGLALTPWTLSALMAGLPPAMQPRLLPSPQDP